MRTTVALIGACVLLLFCAPLPAQVPSEFAWVQYESDGLPHVRTISVGGTCPSLQTAGGTLPLNVRAVATGGFGDTVCDALYPTNARSPHVGEHPLPAIPHDPQRIAVFGDSGCRLLGANQQACNIPLAWPLPLIAQKIAQEHPDLIIHVGDYYYRETACTTTAIDCNGSPHGDAQDSWMADYFLPASPIFGVAPLVLTRGNHEDCTRTPLGWGRYLSGEVQISCNPHEPVSFVTFDHLVLGDVDDATESTETLANPPVFLGDEKIVDARAAESHRETWLVVHRPPARYLYGHQSDDPDGRNLALFLTGHIHIFGAYSFSGAAPNVIVGIGGDTLSNEEDTAPIRGLPGITEARFGYAMFLHRAGGWDIVVHDIDGNVHRRCRLENRTVTCGPALN